MFSRRRRDQDDAVATMAFRLSISEAEISMSRLAPSWEYRVRAYPSLMFVACCAYEKYHVSYSVTVGYYL